jgi:hypothetical protein
MGVVGENGDCAIMKTGLRNFAILKMAPANMSREEFVFNFNYFFCHGIFAFKFCP